MSVDTMPDSAHSAFAMLYERSRRRAYNLAYRLTGNAADAEDVTQDAYVRAWINYSTYDAERPFEGWLFRIITNRVIDMRRRQKRVPMYSIDSPVAGDDDAHPLSHEFASPGSDPEQIVIGPIVDEHLQRAMDALPTDYRRAILMCDVEEKSYADISAAMKCAIGTVRSRIHRARTMLRKSMQTEGPSTASASRGRAVTQPACGQHELAA